MSRFRRFDRYERNSEKNVIHLWATRKKYISLRTTVRRRVPRFISSRDFSFNFMLVLSLLVQSNCTSLFCDSSGFDGQRKNIHDIIPLAQVFVGLKRNSSAIQRNRRLTHSVLTESGNLVSS